MQSQIKSSDAAVNLSLQEEPIAPKSWRWRDVWRSLLNTLGQNPKMLIGLCIVGFFILVAIFGPLFVHTSPNASTNDLYQAPSANHPLGTTNLGEDLYAQLVLGTRASMIICLVAATLSTIISVVIGLAAGYFGGVVDDLLSMLTNVFLTLPVFVLCILIAAFITLKGPLQMILILAPTTWAWGARVLRAQTLMMRNREFVSAARTVGESPLRIIFFEILPNEIGIVAASFVGTAIYCLLTEVTLDFLGLGDFKSFSWGMILYWAQSNQAMFTSTWWWFVPPGLCVALFGAGLTLINYGIDEIANPKLRNESKNIKRVQRAAAKKVAA
jgi:peptide/nickel transport system permease protein